MKTVLVLVLVCLLDSALPASILKKDILKQRKVRSVAELQTPLTESTSTFVPQTQSSAAPNLNPNLGEAVPGPFYPPLPALSSPFTHNEPSPPSTDPYIVPISGQMPPYQNGVPPPPSPFPMPPSGSLYPPVSQFPQYPQFYYLYPGSPNLVPLPYFQQGMYPYPPQHPAAYIPAGRGGFLLRPAAVPPYPRPPVQSNRAPYLSGPLGSWYPSHPPFNPAPSGAARPPFLPYSGGFAPPQFLVAQSDESGHEGDSIEGVQGAQPVMQV
ncbi:basic proline-rich protein-like [Acipenser ruthenus]|uniref:basic proline-rich protein-like n=1 Tax=Acipenser ruthenus TaxID=7906 RepID=UPI00145BD085|nr:basic proline-rich protein-like [Acipenser ruthenus]XP_058864264.1 basic proline-rich protein-like [Acipenser ruthenus]